MTDIFAKPRKPAPAWIDELMADYLAGLEARWEEQDRKLVESWKGEPINTVGPNGERL